MEATFSDSRSMVTTSSSVGKELKSSGFGIHSATISTSTDTASDMARPKSRMIGGSGMNSTDRTSVTPSAKPMSRFFRPKANTPPPRVPPPMRSLFAMA